MDLADLYDFISCHLNKVFIDTMMCGNPGYVAHLIYGISVSLECCRNYRKCSKKSPLSLHLIPLGPRALKSPSIWNAIGFSETVMRISIYMYMPFRWLAKRELNNPFGISTIKHTARLFKGVR